MATVRLFVNAFPPDLPVERVAALLRDYRRERDFPTADSPPRWYVEQAIAALENLAVDRQAVA